MANGMVEADDLSKKKALEPLTYMYKPDDREPME